MDRNQHSSKLEREKEWYKSNGRLSDHPLNSSLFYSSARNNFNYIFPKNIMAKSLNMALSDKPESKILLAPLGSGDDLSYLKGKGRKLTGIDISPDALGEVSDRDVDKLEGDMSNMNMFPEGSFDVVVTPLFFHHYILHGFDPFSHELFRVLKPGGTFISLEPSLFNPISLFARTGKRIFGNITGQVEDEGPFIPQKLVNSLRRAGFVKPKVLGAGFCHNRIPIPLARVCNSISKPFLNIFPFNIMCWMCVFTARKPFNN